MSLQCAGVRLRSSPSPGELVQRDGVRGGEGDAPLPHGHRQHLPRRLGRVVGKYLQFRETPLFIHVINLGTFPHTNQHLVGQDRTDSGTELSKSVSRYGV